MKTDSLFYRLFKRCPKLAIELLGLDYDNDSYCFGSEEVKQTAFRLDGVFTPLSDDMEQPLIFVEVQYQADDVLFVLDTNIICNYSGTWHGSCFYGSMWFIVGNYICNYLP